MSENATVSTVNVAPAAQLMTAMVEAFRDVGPAVQRAGELFAAMRVHVQDSIGADDLGELEAVTETCACHCWANHPDAQGVCGAGSHVGTTVEGQPACLGCWKAAQHA